MGRVDAAAVGERLGADLHRPGADDARPVGYSGLGVALHGVDDVALTVNEQGALACVQDLSGGVVDALRTDAQVTGGAVNGARGVVELALQGQALVGLTGLGNLACGVAQCPGLQGEGVRLHLCLVGGQCLGCLHVQGLCRQNAAARGLQVTRDGLHVDVWRLLA